MAQGLAVGRDTGLDMVVARELVEAMEEEVVVVDQGSGSRYGSGNGSGARGWVWLMEVVAEDRVTCYSHRRHFRSLFCFLFLWFAL